MLTLQQVAAVGVTTAPMLETRQRPAPNRVRKVVARRMFAEVSSLEQIQRITEALSEELKWWLELEET